MQCNKRTFVLRQTAATLIDYEHNLKFCINSQSLSTAAIALAQTVTTSASPDNTLPVTMPTVTMITNAINSVAIAVPVVVLVVCLLVVCAIATIIILYQRAKHHQQDTTK